MRHTSEVYAGTVHGFTMADTAAHSESGEQRHGAALFSVLDRVSPTVH